MSIWSTKVKLDQLEIETDKLNNYRSYFYCVFKDNFHDIFSSLEQEICSLSDTFLYAAGSSWSLNILMERHAAGKVQEEKNEENIHLLFQVLKVLNIHMDEKGNILG